MSNSFADVPTYHFDDKGNIIEEKDSMPMPSITPPKVDDNMPHYDYKPPNNFVTGPSVMIRHPGNIIRHIPLIQQFDNISCISGSVGWVYYGSDD